ncbi:glycosyltransferase family 4 protein [Paraburkholderia sp. BCC1884]|uniref:glycosyltransferase family 4 protein n=1 Tax=Paraburkholderia sp. BCC1884 TaxID=2562668 RepID=UPI0016433EDA|nr:glycosyltransferase family 1 protein [Paraburkholderia sp. BCC1884]
MKLLLVGNYPADDIKSMQAYAQMLLQGCRAAGVEVELTAPKSVLLSRSKEPVGVSKWVAYVDKFIIFPLFLSRKAKRFDRTHICDHSNGMYMFWLPPKTSSITCHDVIAIRAARGLIGGWRTSPFGKVFQALILRGMARAQKIICVSDFTRSDLIGLRPDLTERTTVIRQALHSKFEQDPSWREILKTYDLHMLQDKPYFLHVGSDHPRKNRAAVVQIFAELSKLPEFSDAQLMFVGPPPNQEMNEIIGQARLESRVHAVQNAPMELLNALYSGSQGFIFTSRNEGFGWPIIEAQACGCPVFASSVGPMQEVGGSAAKYIDPDDVAASAATIASADFEGMRRAGLENVGRYNIDRMIRELIETVERD